MRRMRAALAPLLTALALLIVAAPAAAQRKGGEDIPTGDRGLTEVGGRTPGSPRDKALNWIFSDEGDGYGVPFILPYERSSSTTAIGPLALAVNTASSITTFVPLTNAYRYSEVWALVTVTGGAGLASPWSVKVLASEDVSNYATVFRTSSGTVAPPGSVPAVADTLKIKQRGAGVGWYPIKVDGSPPKFKNLAVVASNDTTAASGTLTFTVSLYGRN